MRGQLLDLAVGMDGRQRITIAVNEDFRQQYDALRGADINIDIKRYHRRRSLDANAYAWVLIDKLAEKLGLTKAEVYREQIRSIGGVSQTVCVKAEAAEALQSGWSRNGLGWFAEQYPSKLPGCANVVLFFGSSSYDTRQMSALIDSLIREAEALGIPTITEAEERTMLNAWKG